MHRTRSILELACAIVCGFLAVLTAAVPDWIEVAFRFSPDGGSGMAELAMVVAPGVLSVVLTADVIRLRRLEQGRV